ncbi:uncharacterized protein N7529_005340 [Penicillium soppii]|uniref:uncharacterized protein n=1 Tax=Penicillium soppii TaxID=69789 RepID=UPI0025477F2E|nr:uncharacterized protein N7529_005340 [Penicillium soppii]KAJ5872987.1 hypothetical protein N7529_005340 [Penicillium soppii]
MNTSSLFFTATALRFIQLPSQPDGTKSPAVGTANELLPDNSPETASARAAHGIEEFTMPSCPYLSRRQPDLTPKRAQTPPQTPAIIE